MGKQPIRTIEFRAKAVNESNYRKIGDWCYGHYVHEVTEDKHSIINNVFPQIKFQVDPKTLGQFTGLQDKNGNKIFEGDVLRQPHKNDWEKTNYQSCEVFWHDNDASPTDVGLCIGRHRFKGNLSGGYTPEKLLPKWTSKLIIIGNIHDNPEHTCKYQQ